MEQEDRATATPQPALVNGAASVSTLTGFDQAQEHVGCPFCEDRTSYHGDPAKVFCEKHYNHYRWTF